MNIERPASPQPLPPHAKKVFGGVLFDIYQWEQEMFDGTNKTFEKLTRPDTVVIYPVLPDGRIILINEEQPGLAKHVLPKPVAGRLEPGEDPEAGALRELREESGYDAKTLTLWKAMQGYPTTKVDYAIFSFIAKNITQVGPPELDGGEKITLTTVTFDEFIEIGSNPVFFERDVHPDIVAAKYDPQKREELRKLFDPAI